METRAALVGLERQEEIDPLEKVYSSLRPCITSRLRDHENMPLQFFSKPDHCIARLAQRIYPRNQTLVIMAIARNSLAAPTA